MDKILKQHFERLKELSKGLEKEINSNIDKFKADNDVGLTIVVEDGRVSLGLLIDINKVL